MSRVRDRKQRREKIKRRYRSIVRGSAGRPRLAVYRSSHHVYAQLVDDESGVTLVSASTVEKTLAGGLTSKSASNVAGGTAVGRAIAERAKEKGIDTVVFDRGGFTYHGVVRAIAEAARSTGLKF
jgi:large subunit ribosomal protein L18